jgi:hypothetical protein
LDPNKRSVAEVQLKMFAKSIMSTEIFGGIDKATPPCNDSCVGHTSGVLSFDKCTDQDVRNLRMKKGTSSLGDKTIMKCRECGGSYTSEDFAIADLCKMFGKSKMYSHESRPTYANDFWGKNSRISKAHMCIEMQLMNRSIPHNPPKTRTTPFCVPAVEKKYVGFLRNMHRSDHCGTCCKSDCECRMKLPNKAEEDLTVVFNDNVTAWYTWRGERKERNLFLLHLEEVTWICLRIFKMTQYLVFCNATITLWLVLTVEVPCIVQPIIRKTLRKKTVKQLELLRRK